MPPPPTVSIQAEMCQGKYFLDAGCLMRKFKVRIVVKRLQGGFAISSIKPGVGMSRFLLLRRKVRICN